MQKLIKSAAQLEQPMVKPAISAVAKPSLTVGLDLGDRFSEGRQSGRCRNDSRIYPILRHQGPAEQTRAHHAAGGPAGCGPWRSGRNRPGGGAAKVAAGRAARVADGAYAHIRRNGLRPPATVSRQVCGWAARPLPDRVRVKAARLLK